MPYYRYLWNKPRIGTAPNFPSEPYFFQFPVPGEIPATIEINCGGAGAAGIANETGGGGGGAHAYEDRFSPVARESYKVIVGRGGRAANFVTISGTRSEVRKNDNTVICKAAGGTTYAGGAAADSDGRITRSGGNGFLGDLYGTGGGGGAGATRTTDGRNANGRAGALCRIPSGDGGTGASLTVAATKGKDGGAISTLNIDEELDGRVIPGISGGGGGGGEVPPLQGLGADGGHGAVYIKFYSTGRFIMRLGGAPDTIRSQVVGGWRLY